MLNGSIQDSEFWNALQYSNMTWTELYTADMYTSDINSLVQDWDSNDYTFSGASVFEANEECSL